MEDWSNLEGADFVMTPRSPGIYMIFCREYVYVGNSGDRFKVSDDRMRICGPHQNNYGQCYLSKDEFDTEVATEKLWSNFRNSLSHLRPRGCTIDNIREAARILGIEIKED